MQDDSLINTTIMFLRVQLRDSSIERFHSKDARAYFMGMKRKFLQRITRKDNLYLEPLFAQIVYAWQDFDSENLYSFIRSIPEDFKIWNLIFRKFKSIDVKNGLLIRREPASNLFIDILGQDKFLELYNNSMALADSD